MLYIAEKMEWGKWTEWDCDVACGKGWATRKRVCENKSYHPDPNCETDCEGKDNEEQACDKGCCSHGKVHFKVSR